MSRLLSALLLGAIFISGCVPLKMHGALHEAYAKLEADNQAIKNELDLALAASARLQREMMSLKAGNEALTRKSQDLEAKLREVSRESAVMDTQAVAVQPVVPAPARALDVVLTDAVRDGQGMIRKGPGKGVVTVELSERVLYFNSASATIKPDGLDLLRRIADALDDGIEKEIRVESHADVLIESTRFPSTMALSVARADGVLRYLKTRPVAGLARLSAIGYVDGSPGYPSNGAQSRTQRVEIIVRSK